MNGSGGTKMRSFEHSHSFIVRIWQEPRDHPDAAPICRGVVEHAQTGQRRSFTTLDELGAFMGEHIACLDLLNPLRTNRVHEAWWLKFMHRWR
jgi:hypothetical protein